MTTFQFELVFSKKSRSNYAGKAVKFSVSSGPERDAWVHAINHNISSSNATNEDEAS
jgi:hypothetical protein